MIFQKLAENHEFQLIRLDSLQFTPEECLVIRDFVGTSTNGMYRLKQALEVLRPELKGKLLPPDLRVLLGELEKTGVVPAICKRVELTVSLDENKKRMCTYYYVSNPGHLLEHQTATSILDGTYQDSFSICSQRNKLIMVWGINKSDTDVTCSMRVCNRKKGNSSLHVQMIASIENAAETYENEVKTIFNPEYPTGRFLQRSVNDDYHMMVFKIGASRHTKGAPRTCTCALFLPTPTLERCMLRQIDVELLPLPIGEGLVVYDEQLPTEMGLPPKIPIPADQNSVQVRLVQSCTDGSIMNGYQIILTDGTITSTQRFNDPLNTGNDRISEAIASSQQVITHVGLDGKQVLITTGQCSSSVLCSCPCWLHEGEEGQGEVSRVVAADDFGPQWWRHRPTVPRRPAA